MPYEQGQALPRGSKEVFMYGLEDLEVDLLR